MQLEDSQDTLSQKAFPFGSDQSRSSRAASDLPKVGGRRNPFNRSWADRRRHKEAHNRIIRKLATSLRGASLDEREDGDSMN